MIKFIFKNKLLSILYLVVTIFFCVVSVFSTLSYEPIITAALDADLNGLFSSIGICVALTLFAYILWLATKLLINKIIALAAVDLKNEIFRASMEKSMSFYNEKSDSYFVSILNNDILMIKERYWKNILSFYSVFISYIISLAAVFWANYIIGFILLGLSLLAIAIPKIFDKKVTESFKNLSAQKQSFLCKTQNFVRGFNLVKLFDLKTVVGTRFATYNENLENSEKKANNYVSLVSFVSFIFSFAMYITVFGLGGYLVINNVLTIGMIVVLSQLIGGVMSPLESLPSIWTEIKSMKDINNKVLDLFKNSSADELDKVSLETIEKIELRNVEFQYPNSNKVLKDINLTFKKGKKYAIVGQSGCGKTTLVNLLMKLYSPTKGKIYFNNIDLQSVSNRTTNSRMTLIDQKPFLFEDTIKNNITLFQDKSKEQIDNAIKQSGLKRCLSENHTLDEVVNDNGTNLSGGEVQRICLARSILFDSDILILDEALANLDNKISNDIYKNIFDDKKKCVIVITHALKDYVLQNMDEIIMIKDGSIVEHGTFEELIKNKNYFYNLYNL
ncbi:MAG: ABC transporter ATP-binding protein [Bacilli bacterium]